MTASITNRAHSHVDFGVSWAAALRKRILNHLRERADEAADRSRFAELSPRALADIGMTAAERVAILGFEGPASDPWAPVVLHRL
jgi:uncharacterized protein YjiS (DUF1127 family)